MQNLSRSLKVGILLIAAVLASVVLWRTLFRRGNTGGSYRVYALLHDATGLVVRSRVQTAGIAVGEIDSIRLQGTMARIDVKINGDIRMYHNATIARRAVSVLGEYILVITPGTPEAPPALHNGDRISNVLESGSTDEIMNNLSSISESIRRVADHVASAFGTAAGGQEMQDTLRNVAALADAVNRTVQTNSAVVTHTLANIDRVTTESQPEIHGLLAALRDSTERIDRILGQNEHGTDTVASVQEAARNIGEASRDLRDTLSHANSVAGGVDRGEGTVGRLMRDDTLIDEVQGVAESANDLIEPIARLQTIVGLRSEYNFIANTLKSYVELRLQPREDKYYLLEIVDDPRGYTATTSQITDTTNPASAPHYRTVTRTTTEAFRVSLMFARTIGPVTFRFGIKESTGGAGLDLHLLDDALEIRTDLFDFGENINPRLRFMAAYEVLRRAWIVGGVDDVLNGDRFDYFLGAQLRFNDEDLKSILPFAGGLTASSGGH